MFRKVSLILLFCFVTGVVCAQDYSPPPPTTLDFTGPLQELSGVLMDNLESTNCLGTPVSAGGYVIIPVICKGFGFGLGGGMKVADEGKLLDKASKEKHQNRHGMGGGGGGVVRTVALVVIAPDGTLKVHKIQQNFITEIVKQLTPVMQHLIGKIFQTKMMKYKMQWGGTQQR